MPRRSPTLTGRVAAITGGARGIGRATAQAFVRESMKVAIGDLDLEAAQRTAAELGAATIAVELDVCDRASVARFLDVVEERLGPLDVLVNNAGIMQLGSFIAEDDATARRQVDVNVHGVVLGMKEGIARMLPRGRGHIVNVASTAGKVGFAGGATYSGTKHFVVGVSEAVRTELRGSGIELTCIMPGVVNTELGAGLPQARFVRHIEPEQVAAAIVRALRSPRFDVFVPRAIAPLVGVAGAVPRAVRDGFGRALALDRVLGRPDMDARRAYELRASRSGDGAAAGEPPPRLPPGDDG